MREIKFKAWLPGINKMTYAHSLDELMGWGTKEWTHGTAIWMQFTGLTDGNGKEIYEGDIVDYLCESETSDWMERGVIEWDEELLQYNVGDRKEKLDVDVVENVWVVGNIYANPGLLEVE